MVTLTTKTSRGKKIHLLSMEWAYTISWHSTADLSAYSLSWQFSHASKWSSSDRLEVCQTLRDSAQLPIGLLALSDTRQTFAAKTWSIGASPQLSWCTSAKDRHRWVKCSARALSHMTRQQITLDLLKCLASATMTQKLPMLDSSSICRTSIKQSLMLSFLASVKASKSVVPSLIRVFSVLDELNKLLANMLLLR